MFKKGLLGKETDGLRDLNGLSFSWTTNGIKPGLQSFGKDFQFCCARWYGDWSGYQMASLKSTWLGTKKQTGFKTAFQTLLSTLSPQSYHNHVKEIPSTRHGSGSEAPDPQPTTLFCLDVRVSRLLWNRLSLSVACFAERMTWDLWRSHIIVWCTEILKNVLFHALFLDWRKARSCDTHPCIVPSAQLRWQCCIRSHQDLLLAPVTLNTLIETFGTAFPNISFSFVSVIHLTNSY